MKIVSRAFVLFLFSLLLLVRCHSQHDDNATKQFVDAAIAPPTTPAADAIRAYENAATCENREKTIIFPDRNRAILKQFGCTFHDVKQIDTRECDHATSTCTADGRIEGVKQKYWLVKQPDGSFLVDFRATERPIRLDDIRARMPTTPTIFRGTIEPSASYVGEFKSMRTTHTAFRLRETGRNNSVMTLTVYALTNSDDARKLSALALKTNVTIAIAYAPTRLDPLVANVVKFIAEDFFETPEEDAFESGDGG